MPHEMENISDGPYCQFLGVKMSPLPSSHLRRGLSYSLPVAKSSGKQSERSDNQPSMFHSPPQSSAAQIEQLDDNIDQSDVHKEGPKEEGRDESARFDGA